MKIRLNNRIKNNIQLSNNNILFYFENNCTHSIHNVKNGKSVQSIVHSLPVETVIETNKKLIVFLRYNDFINIERWEHNENGKYIFSGVLQSLLLSSYCFLNVNVDIGNIFFTSYPIILERKDTPNIIQYILEEQKILKNNESLFFHYQ